MEYIISLDAAFSRALAQWAKETDLVDTDLLQSAAMSALQSRVQSNAVHDKATLVAAIEAAPSTATKADILAAIETAKDAEAAAEAAAVVDKGKD